VGETSVLLALICIVFVVGYLCIALEHPLHVNKAASALATGALCWTIYALSSGTLVPESTIPQWFVDSLGKVEHDSAELAIEYLVEGQLHKALAETAGILFFLLGAMTIVELVDAFEGFRLITTRIDAQSKLKLMWIVAFVTFFMSSVLDNLTTTIVMISLLRKLVADRETRLLFVGLVVIAANAGGAWTVIGDVTTTMLWMKEKISTFEVMIRLLLPSLICLTVPLIILSLYVRGDVIRPESESESIEKEITPLQQRLMLTLGLSGLLFVPIFKMVTHLPPYVGMLLALSIVWIVSERIRKNIDHEYTRSTTHVIEILKKVDSSSILFFLGILLAVSCLSYTGLLAMAANALNNTVGNQTIVAILIGLFSAVVDNVPLVAAGIEMYQFETDHSFWHLLAYCAGTGGSCLIIGSAAGVAAMGLERIDFMWYLRRIAPLALIGYLSGVGVYVLIEGMFEPSVGTAPVTAAQTQPLSE
jgi:Na+/H+ antiporter NhaD/arsenite permease-like protein